MSASGEVTTLFWDVGGVILSNGWDSAARDLAAQHFALDRQELEARHEPVFPNFELGRITLSEYIERVVFWRPQKFSREEFEAFMFAQSNEKPEGRAVLDEITASRRYLLATLNNEGLELNDYRISKFHLARNFALFFTSCYLGVRKPDEGIYRLALNVTQRRADECLFIDDRGANVDGARRAGLPAIHFQTPAQLRADLAAHGVCVAAA